MLRRPSPSPRYELASLLVEFAKTFPVRGGLREQYLRRRAASARTTEYRRALQALLEQDTVRERGDPVVHATFLAPRAYPDATEECPIPHDTTQPARAPDMDVVYRLGQATALKSLAELPIRRAIPPCEPCFACWEEKGHVRHEAGRAALHVSADGESGQSPETAMRHLVRTFFDGSTEDAVAALLPNDAGISTDELSRLAKLIDGAKKEGT